jgi:hypothetical protein
MTATVVSLQRSQETGPSPVHGNLPPKRIPNLAVRSREYLTPDEVEGLIKAAKNIGRHGHRDAALILLAYRVRRQHLWNRSSSGLKECSCSSYLEELR